MSMQELDTTVMTSTTSHTDWNRKTKDLESIRDTIERYRYSTVGPRKVQAMRVTFMILVVGSTISFCLRSAEGFAATCIAGVIAYWLVSFLGTRPRTWTELLDSKLASYEPIHVDAYRELQAKSRTNYLDANDLREWLELEAAALRNAAGLDGTKASAFLSKQV